MGPGKTATIWGFWKATSLAEAVTVSLRMTPVDSKFNLLTETVTTSMNHLSSSVWSGRTMGLVDSTTDAVVGTVERTIASPSSGGFARPGGVCPTLSAVGEVIDLTGEVSSSGGGPNINEVVPCAICLLEFDPIPLTSVMVAWVMGCPWGTAGSWFAVLGAILPRPKRTFHF